MSKLEDLIAKLCPDGVEYRTIKDVCNEVIVPMRDRPKRFDGNIPWCRIEDKEGQYFNDSLSGLRVTKDVIKEMNLKVFPTGTVICSCSASLGAYAINTQPLITNQTFIGLVCGENLYNKYLLYYMETQTDYLRSQASTGTIPYISRKKFEEMRIPVPPLPVQSEIVRILDNFTELTVKLTAELTAEITARKEQYEYYRDKLLTFGDEVEWKTLGDVLTIKNGKDYKNFNEGNIPVYGSGGIITYIDRYAYDKPSVLIPRKGSINKLYYVDVPFWTVDTIFYTEINPEIINPKYVYYYLKTQHLEKLNTAGGVPSLTQTVLKTVSIPIPLLYEQERIIAILDRFDALCNDISAGLPAEIEARQKQYDYYRDKLLTFKELS